MNITRELKRYCLLVLITFFFVPGLSNAADVKALTINNQLIDTDTLDPITWTRWGLQETEWKAYQEYMQGEGKFHYEHLDPVFVLGIMAKTPQERKRFADLYASQEYSRNERVISFEREFRESLQGLYGPLRPFDPQFMAAIRGESGAISKTTQQGVQIGDALTMFVSTDCSQCESALSRALQIRKSKPGMSLDIYFVGESVSDEDIRQWAISHNIPESEVAQQSITLNHDDRYNHFGKPGIPSTWIVRGNSVVGEL